MRSKAKPLHVEPQTFPGVPDAPFVFSLQFHLGSDWERVDAQSATALANQKETTLEIRCHNG